jgi:hypothetical protein
MRLKSTAGPELALPVGRSTPDGWTQVLARSIDKGYFRLALARLFEFGIQPTAALGVTTGCL